MADERKKRSSQDEQDVKVFNFKLDRRIPRQAAARKRLESLMQEKGFSLREQFIHWLNESDKEIVFIDENVSAAVENAMGDFREELIQDIATLFENHLMQANPETLRRMADEPETKQEFSNQFVEGMMKGFRKPR